MKRRAFFQQLFGSVGLAATAATGSTVALKTRSVLIQESPIAGFQFHEGDAIWPSLAVGVKLALLREAKNTHDPDAVAVYFQDNKLGYVPRAENSAIAQMLDRGETLEARISKLLMEEDSWERVRFTVFLV